MLFPESWLRTLVDPELDTEALAHLLTMAGLEVEGTRPVAPPFTGVVTARIVSAAPHPDADRLQVCSVDDGSGESLQIVCGAPNARAGIVVPLARLGAELPGGLKIGAVTMRGVRSSGMLCSARELGLSQDHSGLLELDTGLAPGRDVRDVLDLDDICFELKLTPNRADCLSLHGIAREVAALTGAPLQQADVQPAPVTIGERLAVQVKAPDLCGRFAGRVIRGVNARAQTPEWMARRLLRAGQRPVSALVDISNYIMLALGRPTHVFDLDKLAGPLEVRWANEGESLTLLNGQTVALDPSVGIITAGGKVESLAGIMGGDATAVSLDTTAIYLEGAFWWPEAIMGRARRFKFSSEASHRFERGVDAESIIEHLEATTQLILEICGGQAGPLDDQVLQLPGRPPVRMRLARCCKVLGITLSREQVADIFTRLAFAWESEGEDFVITPPSWRFDLAIEEDFIEEVARVHGFENIPTVPPRAPALMRSEPETRRGPHALRARMAACDYQEVINFAFVPPEWEQQYTDNGQPIRLLNPIASHLAVMRSSLIGGLLANIHHNAQHRQTRVRVFELGRVFRRNPGAPAGALDVAGVEQPMHLAAAAWGPAVVEQWGCDRRQVDFYDVKRDLEALAGERAQELRFLPEAHPALHPGRSARIWMDDAPIGWMGEVHPRWMQALELNHPPVVFEVVAAALETLSLPRLKTWSRQPVVVRDLAIWLDAAVSFGQVSDTLEQTKLRHSELDIIQEVRLFDVWRDQAAQSGQKSLALRFWLQDQQATLDDARVEHCMDLLLQALQAAHGARLRSQGAS
ncbi:MAG: phenylalanine--tRNA ligase subunit beta [Castellaniella sp.]